MTDSRKGYVRMRTLQAVVLLIFGVIILRLAYIQLIDPKYEKLARGNALRHVVQYPPRGEIFDRNGEYLAQNRVCYDLMVIYRELPREGFDTLQMLDLLGISRTKLERALRNARMNVGYTELRSPIDGIIEHTAAHVGDYVGPGTQFSVLTTVSNIDTLTVDVAIPMSQYLRYAGDRTSIYDNEGLLSDIRLVLADGSRYPLGGIYDYTRKDVSSTTGTLVVVVMFPNPDETLKPGQFARVEASVGPVRPRVVVPQQAVSQTQDIASVWVVEADSTVHYRRVTPGDTYGAMWCIDEGLDRGERVVVAGQQKLHDGAKVIPENPTARRTEQAAAAEQAGKRLEKR